MIPNVSEQDKDYSKGLLIGAAILTVVLWQVPFGNFILYPFFILGTWFHEMGHGLMAIFMGGEFVKLEVFPNGSGLAYYQYRSLWPGTRIGISMIAAAGLIMPPMVGALFILGSRSQRGAQISLYILFGFMVLSALIWVRNLFGWAAISGMAALLFLAIRYSKGKKIQFLAKFIGVQASLATFLNWRYLFTPTAGVGSAGISDVGYIEQQLFLPYWFWGGLIAVFSAGLLFLSLHWAYRPRTK